jgi:aminoglycoside phosphotransferase (APT) family kinase protein
VYGWIDGETAEVGQIDNLTQFTEDLTDFLAALYQVDATGGPPPGEHNFFLGGPPAVYDAQAKEALAALKGHIDTELASEVWQAALGAIWHGDPVWFHGDAQPGDLLVRHGRPPGRAAAAGRSGKL